MLPIKRIASLLALTLVFAGVSVAQNFKIAGVVNDTVGQPIPYATVSLLRTDSTLAGGTITDDNGHWSIDNIAKGKYVLSVSFIGYETSKQNLTISKNISNVIAVLREEAVAIQTVEVVAKQRLVERHADKIVLNVSESTLAIGSNGSDILKKSPGVNVDKDGNVTVNGKSVEVYINGKPSYMSGDQLRGLLEGTDGSMIDKIEIITNPSSKYDAAGQGGVIDIKLKRSKENSGLSGTVSGHYGGMYFKDVDRYTQNDNLSLNLNYSGKNTYTTFMLSQSYDDQLAVANSNTVTRFSDAFDGGIMHELAVNSKSKYDKGDFQYYMMRLTNDWMIDGKNTFGFILQVPVFSYFTDSRKPNTSETLLDGVRIQAQNARTYSKAYSPQHTANLNYTHTFADSLMRELTVNVDYSRFASDNKNDAWTEYTSGAPYYGNFENVRINTDMKVNIFSAKADFQTAFWKTGMIECGLKWSMVNTDNHMTTDSVMGEYSSTDRQDFKYSEQVGAAYISVAKQFDKHWSAKLGLRGELTYAKGDWISADTTTGGDPYFNLFPTAYLAYAPTDNWMLSASYSRRIGRPSYSQLAPFVRYIDSRTRMVGNPDLKPETGNNFSFNVTYSQYVSLSYDFGQVSDMRNQRVYVLDNGDVELHNENFGKYQAHSLTLALTEIPLVHVKSTNTTWLTLTANLTGGYSLNENADYRQETWSASVYGDLTLHLPYDIKFDIDGWWQSPVVYGYMKCQEMYMINAGIKKQFLNKALTLTLKVDDIFRSMRMDVEMTDGGGAQSVVYYQNFFNQKVTVGLSYNFGKMTYHKYRKVGNLEEGSRVGGNTGGGIGN